MESQFTKMNKIKNKLNSTIGNISFIQYQTCKYNNYILTSFGDGVSLSILIISCHYKCHEYHNTSMDITTVVTNLQIHQID